MNQNKKFLLEQGKMLPVMEHFYSIQGEGFHAGKAAYFIRLAGCNIGCHWCDVKESWDSSLYPLVEVVQIAKIAANYCKTIIITGGEPLMWNLELLTKALYEEGCTVHIETSGVYSISGKMDWITLSPKKKLQPKEEVYQNADELKVVIYNQHDFIFAQEQAERVTDNCILYLQSEWSKRDRNYEKIAEFLLRNPRWRFSIQIHKYLNIP